MNKTPKLIAVLVVIFIFGIQLLVFESYQSLFPTSDKNDNNYLIISSTKENNDNNDDGEFESKICNKLLDSETCKKIEEEIKSKTKKLTKETQEEAITSKYLEPADSNQNTINNIEQTTESEQIGNSEPKQNEIVKSDTISQNQSSLPPSTPSPINTSDSSSNSLSLANLNTLDQNQLIDAISSKISQVHNFEKNKITQAILDLTKATAAKGGDAMKNLRQIATIILKNPSDPLSNKILGLAQTK